jgi:nucleoporin NUP82
MVWFSVYRFSSLLKLGCREYDPTVDADEPLQTISFVKKKAKSTGYGIHDVSEAVSFAIGQGQNDWAPFTVYGLMQNGDVYAVCPFMPTKACVSLL